MFKATIAATALMFTSVAAHSGTIQTKPVLCGTPQEAFGTVKFMNQTKMFEAVQITTVKSPEGFSAAPILLPLTIYMNLDDKTYSILEYHPEYKQYCLISFGSEGKFVNE